MKTFKSLVERQQDEEVRANCRFGPYRLSDRYKMFEVDSVKWHAMDPEARLNHVELNNFGDIGRLWMTSLINQNQVVENRVIESRPESQILKVCLTGWTKRKKKAGNRLTSRIQTLRKRYRKSYFFVQWYHAWLIDARGYAVSSGQRRYLVVKSRGRIRFMNKQGETNLKYCPLYIRFKTECLKEYARRIDDVH